MHILVIYEKFHFQELLPFVRVGAILTTQVGQKKACALAWSQKSEQKSTTSCGGGGWVENTLQGEIGDKRVEDGCWYQGVGSQVGSGWHQIMDVGDLFHSFAHCDLINLINVHLLYTVSQEMCMSMGLPRDAPRGVRAHQWRWRNFALNKVWCHFLNPLPYEILKPP